MTSRLPSVWRGPQTLPHRPPAHHPQTSSCCPPNPQRWWWQSPSTVAPHNMLLPAQPMVFRPLLLPHPLPAPAPASPCALMMHERASQLNHCGRTTNPCMLCEELVLCLLLTAASVCFCCCSLLVLRCMRPFHSRRLSARSLFALTVRNHQRPQPPAHPPTTPLLIASTSPSALFASALPRFCIICKCEPQRASCVFLHNGNLCHSLCVKFTNEPKGVVKHAATQASKLFTPAGRSAR